MSDGNQAVCHIRLSVHEHGIFSRFPASFLSMMTAIFFQGPFEVFHTLFELLHSLLEIVIVLRDTPNFSIIPVR